MYSFSSEEERPPHPPKMRGNAGALFTAAPLGGAVGLPILFEIRYGHGGRPVGMGDGDRIAPLRRDRGRAMGPLLGLALSPGFLPVDQVCSRHPCARRDLVRRVLRSSPLHRGVDSGVQEWPIGRVACDSSYRLGAVGMFSARFRQIAHSGEDAGPFAPSFQASTSSYYASPRLCGGSRPGEPPAIARFPLQGTPGRDAPEAQSYLRRPMSTNYSCSGFARSPNAGGV